MSTELIGRTVAPEKMASTLEEVYFWADYGSMVEKSTPVTITSTVQLEGAEEEVVFLGVVDEASYQSSTESIHDDRRRYEDDPSSEPYGVREEGTAFYKVQILKTRPDLHIPPKADAVVRRASVDEAQEAYGMDEIDGGIPVGLLRAGARATAGPFLMDPAFIYGENGAHINANGTSGIAVKTTTLLTFMRAAQSVSRSSRSENPSGEHFVPVPVLFNVKGADLLYIDQPSRKFNSDPAHQDAWQEMGVQPEPFLGARFMVPGTPSDPNLPRPLANRPGLEAYNWGLQDVIERGLLHFLFTEEDMANQNFRFLVNRWEQLLTRWEDGRRVLHHSDDLPKTFEQLCNAIAQDAGHESTAGRGADYTHAATAQKLYRRLMKVKYEAEGVIVWDRPLGRPPTIKHTGIPPAHVIDLASISSAPDLQRFVIASVLQDLLHHRTKPSAPRGVRYLVMLDELNQWAPRGGRDPITRLLERIASEMRSLGIVLCGAQQFASQVSARIPENSALRIIGRTGPGELTDDLYRFLTPADRRAAARLRPGELLVYSPNMRGTAAVRLPFPPWATGPEDVLAETEIIEVTDAEIRLPDHGIGI